MSEGQRNCAAAQLQEDSPNTNPCCHRFRVGVPTVPRVTFPTAMKPKAGWHNSMNSHCTNFSPSLGIEGGAPLLSGSGVSSSRSSMCMGNTPTCLSARVQSLL